MIEIVSSCPPALASGVVLRQVDHVGCVHCKAAPQERQCNGIDTPMTTLTPGVQMLHWEAQAANRARQAGKCCTMHA